MRLKFLFSMVTVGLFFSQLLKAECNPNSLDPLLVAYENYCTGVNQKRPGVKFTQFYQNDELAFDSSVGTSGVYNRHYCFRLKPYADAPTFDSCVATDEGPSYLNVPIYSVIKRSGENLTSSCGWSFRGVTLPPNTVVKANVQKFKVNDKSYSSQEILEARALFEFRELVDDICAIQGVRYYNKGVFGFKASKSSRIGGIQIPEGSKIIALSKEGQRSYSVQLSSDFSFKDKKYPKGSRLLIHSGAIVEQVLTSKERGVLLSSREHNLKLSIKRRSKNVFDINEAPGSAIGTTNVFLYSQLDVTEDRSGLFIRSANDGLPKLVTFFDRSGRSHILSRQFTYQDERYSKCTLEPQDVALYMPISMRTEMDIESWNVDSTNAMPPMFSGALKKAKSARVSFKNGPGNTSKKTKNKAKRHWQFSEPPGFKAIPGGVSSYVTDQDESIVIRANPTPNFSIVESDSTTLFYHGDIKPSLVGVAVKSEKGWEKKKSFTWNSHRCF